MHGWDLAVATGQPSEADPAIAEAGLAAGRQILPADFRGGPVPFAEVVPSAPDAGLTERLATEAGFALDVTHVALSGHCRDCQDRDDR